MTQQKQIMATKTLRGWVISGRNAMEMVSTFYVCDQEPHTNGNGYADLHQIVKKNSFQLDLFGITTREN